MGNIPAVDVFISGGFFHRGHAVYTPCYAPCIPPLPDPVPMLPRRNSTNPTTGHVSPRAGSGSTSGRRPLSLATTHQVFRVSTAFTVETESPVSEISPRESLPIAPPRPVSLSRLPPGNSGLRRDVPPQPQSMPAVTPHVPQTSEPPTQTRSQQPAPGSGIGGFTSTSPPYHGPNHDCSHHSTADYTYRFHALPSPRSDSSPPQYRSADISGGIHADVWPTYNKISREFDEKRLAKWNGDLDVLLIFVSTVVKAAH